MKPTLAICVLLLSACAATPEGERAKADAAIISKNAAVAQKATRDAKDGNASIQTHADAVQNLDARVDAKDAVIDSWYKQHENRTH